MTVAANSPAHDALATTSAGAALSQGIARLEAASIPSAPLAAELLMLGILERDRTWLYAHPEHALVPAQLAQYSDFLQRRAAGVPVQYLTGRQEFWGLEFEVTPSVLIPRPESEHLIEVAVERRNAQVAQPLRVADVGTGSGCLAVALAREFPQAQIVATDISSAALDVAERNAARHHVANRIQFLPMNLLQSYLDAAAPPFDLIVSNPPYIGRVEQQSLQREVVEHEPHEALFAGEEGLDVYPLLIAQAAELLRPGGLLILELGYGLADRVAALLADPSHWTEVRVTNDLAGIPRVLSAARVPPATGALR